MGNQIFSWSPIAVERFSAVVRLLSCRHKTKIRTNGKPDLLLVTNSCTPSGPKGLVTYLKRTEGGGRAGNQFQLCMLLRKNYGGSFGRELSPDL